MCIYALANMIEIYFCNVSLAVLRNISLCLWNAQTYVSKVFYIYVIAFVCKCNYAFNCYTYVINKEIIEQPSGQDMLFDRSGIRSGKEGKLKSFLF
jgi:hypothetical protein